MKTLKKTLCMVLAVVMVVGVLILPASADEAADKAKAQKAAYETLKDYGIMHGRDGGAEALDEYVRRDEVATIVYRIMTGDNTEDGKNAGNFKAAAKNFTDVATTNWAAGFIGYTAESKIFSGREGNKFDPTANVRGDELVKVMLRCLGYGAEDEYTGDGWNTRALYTAQEIGMLKGVDEEMDKPITRGAVSQIVKNAIDLPMAVYYDGTYSIYHDNAGRPAAPNSGATQNAKLVAYDKGTGAVDYDKWGIPSRTDKPIVYFNHPNNRVKYELGEVKVSIKPVAEYYHAITQCDLADDLDLDSKTTFTVWVNGKVNETTIDVYATNTVAKLGAQGRHTLVYDLVADDDDTPDTIVYIDTLLAEVTSVVAPTFDAKGHIKTAAKLNMTVYTGNTSTPQAVTQEKTDGTSYAYAKGDMLLVNYIQNGLNGTTGVDVSGTDNGYGNTVLGNDAAAKGKNVKILGAATAVDGKQTTIYYNQNKHKIDGVDYNDNNRFHLDQAGQKGGTYTWYYDNSPEGKNLIGSKNIKSEASFGVITRLWAEIVSGAASVKANVTYVDGHTATVEVGKVVVDGNGYNHSNLNSAVSNDTNLIRGTATYLNNTGVAGTRAMTFSSNTYFYVSDNYSENLNGGGKNPGTLNHIIGGNLFKVVANGSKYDFIEVIGDGTNDNVSNVADFTGLGNAKTTVKTGVVKNSVLDDGTTAGTGAVVVNDNTRFLIKTGGDGTDAKPYTFESKVGYTNIVEYVAGEVDYADVDDDGYADVVYIVAAPKAASGDHIFFSEAVLKTDKGDNEWELNYSYDTSSKVYTVYGWLDGVYGAVQIKDAANDTVKNFVTKSTGNQLWLVTITNGLVTDIDGKLNNNQPITAASASNAYGSGEALDGTNGMNTPGATYKDMKLLVYTTKGDAKTDEISGTILKLGGNYFGVSALKDEPTVGAWGDVLVKDTVVYVVYDKDGTATQVYVVPKDTGSSYVTPGTSTPGTYTLSPTATYSSGTLTIDGGFSVSGAYFTEGSTVDITVKLEVLTPGVVNGWTTLTTKDYKTVAVSGSNIGNRGIRTTIDYPGLTSGNTYHVVVTATYGSVTKTVTLGLEVTA